MRLNLSKSGLGASVGVKALRAILAAPLAAQAQQAGRVYRIGYLVFNRATAPHLPEAFRQGLRDLGYVEGGNVVIEYRDAEGRPERLPALAAELVALKVDVILAGGTPHALAAQQATKTLPIVFRAAEQKSAAATAAAARERARAIPVVQKKTR